MTKRKLLARALSNPRGLRFDELRVLAQAFGFRLARVNGSHHIYEHPIVGEFLNLQEVKGEAKPYQVRAFLALIEKYNLKLEE